MRLGMFVYIERWWNYFDIRSGGQFIADLGVLGVDLLWIWVIVQVQRVQACETVCKYVQVRASACKYVLLNASACSCCRIRCAQQM